MTEATDGTGAGLLAFLDWAGAKGEIPLATAKSIAVAAGKVLAIDGDPALMDLRTTNCEDLYGRFETLHRLDYTTDSLRTYRSRFFRAVSMYLSWLDKRPDWKQANLYTSRTVAVRANDNGGRPAKARSARPKRPAPSQAEPAEVIETVLAPTAVAMVGYELPLRPGLRVRLSLPEDLTQADAKRISAFVDSLAFDQVEASPEGAR